MLYFVFLEKLPILVKFIVILSERKKLTNLFGDKALSKYSNIVLLKDQFNKEGLINARKEVLSNV